MDKSKYFSAHLIKIFKKAVDNKIYGSVEVYFESGRITQITQRIINKLQNNRTLKGAFLSQVAKPKKLTVKEPKDKNLVTTMTDLT